MRTGTRWPGEACRGQPLRLPVRDENIGRLNEGEQLLHRVAPLELDDKRLLTGADILPEEREQFAVRGPERRGSHPQRRAARRFHDGHFGPPSGELPRTVGAWQVVAQFNDAKVREWARHGRMLSRDRSGAADLG
jgi:hypothetical protein